MTVGAQDAERSRGHFPTDRWPVQLLLAGGACTTCDEPVPRLPGGRWLEPCAGDGAIIHATREVRSDVRWTACEIDDDLATRFLVPARERGEIATLAIGDYFATAGVLPLDAFRFDVSLTNPPFPDAHRFAADLVRRCTWVALLERLDWLKPTKERRDLYRTMGHPDVWVLPARPRFRGRGQDSGEYGWMLWTPTSTGRVHHLPAVSRELRAENRKQLRLGVA